MRVDLNRERLAGNDLAVIARGAPWLAVTWGQALSRSVRVSLRAMIRNLVESNFAPGLSIERRNLIQRRQVTFRCVAAVEVQQDYRFPVAPRRRVLFFCGRAAQLERRIRSELHSLRRKQS